MFKGAIFDVDGTLLDSLPSITAAANAGLAALGLRTFDVPDVRGMSGGGTRLLMENCVTRAQGGAAPTDAQVAAAVAAKSAYANGPDGHALTSPFDGIHDMLRALHAAGVQLAVLSNAEERIVQRLMRDHFPDIEFKHVAGQRDDTPPKPDPTSTARIVAQRFVGLVPAQCAFVGDTENDVRAARAAGCVPVAVAWGCRDPKHLVAVGAAVCVQTPQEVVDFITKPSPTVTTDS